MNAVEFGKGIADIMKEMRGEVEQLRADIAALRVIVQSKALTFGGIYAEGAQYEPGTVATHNGSAWHCNERTTDRPGTSKAWTMFVKRGRDGRDIKPESVT
jgi:hypothetical protein